MHNSSDESKAIAKAITTAEQNKLDAMERTYPTAAGRRAAQAWLDETKEGYLKGLDQRRGKRAQAHSFMYDALQMAMQAGFALSGAKGWKMTPGQYADLADLVEAEVEFFMRYTANEAITPRLRLYAGAVDSSFWRGWLSTLPSTAVIEWRLGPAEHCMDCLGLAFRSPYSKPGVGRKQLPTVPRNGDTQCLANCKCSLHAKMPGGIDSGLFNDIGVEVIAIGAMKVDANSSAARGAAAMYQEAVERYAFYLRMDELDPDGGWGRLAREEWRKLEDAASNVGHTVRLRASKEEILSLVRQAKLLGLRFVKPQDLDDDLLLAVATAIAMNESHRGVIEAVEQNPPEVVFEDGRRYRLDAIGRHILFVGD